MIASFSRIVDYYDAAKITDLLLDDIVNDIDECADKEFNDCDIDIAIGRVLMNKLGID